MLKPDYYPLKKAAEILKCTEDEIIHLGACGKLPIYMLTKKFFVKLKHIDANGETVGKGSMNGKLAKLAVYCLQEFEAGDKQARAIIEPQPDKRDNAGKPDKAGGAFHFPIYHKELFSPSEDMIRAAQKAGIKDDEIFDLYQPPVLLQNCVLVILPDDLERLQQQTQQAGTVGDGGAGSQGDTEPESIKNIKPNSNELDFSGLLNKPQKQDDWFEVIDVMTEDFHNSQVGKMPTKAQAWAKLCDNPPEGYGITIGGKNNDCLNMPGVNPLSKRSFDRRWKKYTNKAQ